MACLFVILFVTVLVDGVSSTVYCKFKYIDSDKLTTTYYTQRCSDSAPTIHVGTPLTPPMQGTDNTNPIITNPKVSDPKHYRSQSLRSRFRSYRSKSYRSRSSTSIIFHPVVWSIIILLTTVAFICVLGLVCYCCRKCRAKKARPGEIILLATPNTRMHDMHDMGTTPSYPLLALSRPREPRNDFIASSRV